MTGRVWTLIPASIERKVPVTLGLVETVLEIVVIEADVSAAPVRIEHLVADFDGWEPVEADETSILESLLDYTLLTWLQGDRRNMTMTYKPLAVVVLHWVVVLLSCEAHGMR